MFARLLNSSREEKDFFFCKVIIIIGCNSLKQHFRCAPPAKAKLIIRRGCFSFNFLQFIFLLAPLRSIIRETRLTGFRLPYLSLSPSLALQLQGITIIGSSFKFLGLSLCYQSQVEDFLSFHLEANQNRIRSSGCSRKLCLINFNFCKTLEQFEILTSRERFGDRLNGVSQSTKWVSNDGKTFYDPWYDLTKWTKFHVDKLNSYIHKFLLTFLRLTSKKNYNRFSKQDKNDALKDLVKRRAERQFYCESGDTESEKQQAKKAILYGWLVCDCLGTEHEA